MDRKKTPIADDAGEAFFQQNGRLVVNRELQRRNGMAATTFAQQASPILAIVNGGPGGGTPGPWTIIQPSNGSLVGFQSPTMRWTEGGFLPPLIVQRALPYSLVMNVPVTTQAHANGEVTSSDAAIADIMFPIPPQQYNWAWQPISDPNFIYNGAVTPLTGTDSFTNAPSVTIATAGNIGTLVMQLTCTFLSEPATPSLSATWTLNFT